MLKKLFVHMIHTCWALSIKQIIKRVFLKTGGVKIKSYDIYSFLEGHSILNTGLFRRKRFIRLDMY